MMRIRLLPYGVAGPAGALGLAALLAAAGHPRAFADERPKASKAVEVPVQGGDGAVAPMPGAPPVAEPSLAARPAAGAALASAAGAGPVSRPQGAPPAIRAISFGDGEATLEIDGVPEVVRPGSRIGAHTVKSVAPGRIVLARSLAGPTAAGSGHVHGAAQTTGAALHGAGPTLDGAGRFGGARLVIVTFDAAGEGKPRVFWASDPDAPAPAPAEVKRP